jgi:hypothetical protein
MMAAKYRASFDVVEENPQSSGIVGGANGQASPFRES